MSILKNLGRASLPCLGLASITLASTAALAVSPEVMTFSGKCSTNATGSVKREIANFRIESRRDECPSQSFDFNVDDDDGKVRKYSVYVEFQRGQFGPGLNDKPAIALSDSESGFSVNSAMVFNVLPGSALIFSALLPGGNFVDCFGSVQ